MGGLIVKWDKILYETIPDLDNLQKAHKTNNGQYASSANLGENTKRISSPSFIYGFTKSTISLYR